MISYNNHPYIEKKGERSKGVGLVYFSSTTTGFCVKFQIENKRHNVCTQWWHTPTINILILILPPKFITKQSNNNKNSFFIDNSLISSNDNLYLLLLAVIAEWLVYITTGTTWHRQHKLESSRFSWFTFLFACYSYIVLYLLYRFDLGCCMVFFVWLNFGYKWNLRDCSSFLLFMQQV